MTSNKIQTWNLEKHPTKDIQDAHVNGDLTVIWRDWDKFLKDYPKMVYISSINPSEVKGPHLHKKRTSFFTCIHGSVIFVIKDENGNYQEIEVNSEKPVLICVPSGIASGHVNPTPDISKVLVLADISWKPNDDEMVNVEFEDYNFNKWKINHN